MNNDQNLKKLMEDVAKDRLERARTYGPGTDEGDAAFKEGLQAFNAYNEFVKTEDAHEELIERRAMEKEQKAREEKIRRKDRTKDYITVGLTIVGTAIITPLAYHFSNKSLARFLCEAEQFETFTSTAGKSLGKMFKFGK